MPVDIYQSLWQEFVVESGEHLDRLEPLLVAIESEAPGDGGSADRVGILFRGMHSIKGMAAALTLKGMEHVKRSLENTVAQQSLKLESGLILLAIAVSGAPFLGLLGTVWGVMSTFGHIAQQQNASLLAMAPGVSAALVTTVAGLLVAIPSMFGYNWLAIQIKNVSADTQVFADQFLTEAAELYSA